MRYKLKTENPRVILERSVSEVKDLARDVNKKTKNPRVILERSASEVKDLARDVNKKPKNRASSSNEA